MYFMRSWPLRDLQNPARILGPFVKIISSLWILLLQFILFFPLKQQFVSFCFIHSIISQTSETSHIAFTVTSYLMAVALVSTRKHSSAESVELVS